MTADRSRDLDAVVPEFDFDSQRTTDRFNISSQSVQLNSRQIAAFDVRDAVLPHAESLGYLHLGQRQGFAEFLESIGADLVEHPGLVCIDS